MKTENIINNLNTDPKERRLMWFTNDYHQVYEFWCLVYNSGIKNADIKKRKDNWFAKPIWKLKAKCAVSAVLPSNYDYNQDWIKSAWNNPMGNLLIEDESNKEYFL
jgi:hypothetical protein